MILHSNYGLRSIQGWTTYTGKASSAAFCFPRLLYCRAMNSTRGKIAQILISIKDVLSFLFSANGEEAEIIDAH